MSVAAVLQETARINGRQPRQPLDTTSVSNATRTLLFTARPVQVLALRCVSDDRRPKTSGAIGEAPRSNCR